jgi:hypothetical protein
VGVAVANGGFGGTVAAGGVSCGFGGTVAVAVGQPPVSTQAGAAPALVLSKAATTTKAASRAINLFTAVITSSDDWEPINYKIKVNYFQEFNINVN